MHGLAAVQLLWLAFLAACAKAKTIHWSGYDWDIRQNPNEAQGPGKNFFNENNVFVDADKRLHLQLSHNLKTNRWYSAQASSVQHTGFGTYKWTVDTNVGNLPYNVVLGLFVYPYSYSIGPDGTNEIDIEYSRWGDATNPNNLAYTLYPNRTGIVKARTYGTTGANGYSGDVTTKDFAYRNDPNPTEGVTVDANGYSTVNKFKWCPGSVTWSATRTNSKGLTAGVSGQPQVQYTYTALPKSGLIPENKLAVFMNLWIFQKTASVPHTPPSNSQFIDVVISKFSYTAGTC